MSTLTKVCLPLCFIILLVQSAVIGYYCHSNTQMILLTIVSIIEVFMFSTLMPRGELHDAAAAGMEEQTYWDDMANTLWDQEMAKYQALAYLDNTAHLAVDYSWMDGMTIDESEEIINNIINN